MRSFKYFLIIFESNEFFLDVNIKGDDGDRDELDEDDDDDEEDDDEDEDDVNDGQILEIDEGKDVEDGGVDEEDNFKLFEDVSALFWLKLAADADGKHWKLEFIEENEKLDDKKYGMSELDLLARLKNCCCRSDGVLFVDSWNWNGDVKPRSWAIDGGNCGVKGTGSIDITGFIIIGGGACDASGAGDGE